MTALVPMKAVAFEAFLHDAIASYARQNVASGRWSAESAMELSRAEHDRLLPNGLATENAHIFEIRDPGTDAAVGTLWLAVQRGAGAPTGYVFNVEVDEAHRRKGHARRALEALDPICRDLGLASVGLNVFAFNTAARRLYESAGYEPTAIIMRKSLRREGGV